MDPVTLYLAAMATMTVATIISTKIAERRMNSPEYKEKIRKLQEEFQEQNNKSNNELSEKYMKDYANLKDFSEDNKAKKIRGEHSIDDDVNAVNPLYDQNMLHTTVNCTLCALTYDLRRRGYNVTAKMSTKGSIPDVLIDELYNEKEPKLEMKDCNTWDKVSDKILSSYPEGARGHFTIRSPYGMGHSMVFEIEKGKVVVRDPQNGDKEVNLNKPALQFYPPSMASVDRLDNRTVNWKNASKVCAELKPNWKKHVPERRKQEQAIPVTGSKPVGNRFGQITEYEKMMIQKYKREHDTNLSDKEILENIRL